MASSARVVAAVLAVLVVAACGGGGSAPVPEGAVAAVGDRTVSRADLDALLKQAAARSRAQGRPLPPVGSSQYAGLERQVVQYLVQQAEYTQEAETMGVRISDRQVTERLDALRRRYFGGNAKRYRAQLRTQALTERRVRENVRAQLMLEGIYRKLTASLAISDEGVRRFYESHRKRYLQPQSRVIRQLLLPDRRSATRVGRLLRRGGSFDALARRYGHGHASGPPGARLTVQRGQTVAAFDRAVFQLRTGTISKPVKTRVGFYLIKALAPVRSPRPTPLARVRETIRGQLLAARRARVISRWAAETRKAFAGKVTYAPGYGPTAPGG